VSPRKQFGTTVRIREAEPDDYSRCAEIYTEGWNSALPEQSRSIEPTEFVRETSGEKIFVALSGRKIVGYVSIWKQDWFIHHLYIDPTVHGQGVGRQLLLRVFDLASKGCVSLKCQIANHRAIDFYSRCGFQPTGHTGTDTYGEWLELAREPPS